MPQFSLLAVWSAIFLAIGTGGLISLNRQDPVQQEVRETETLPPGASQSGRVGSLDDLPPKEDLVKEWENPDFVLFVTGQLHGYIEPCGCTGLENQNGGLQRRFEALNILKARGWNVVAIDAGDQTHRVGLQPIVKLQTVYEALCKLMGYQAIGFGPGDLKTSAIDLGQAMMDKADLNNSPFVSANVTVLDESLTRKFRMIEAGGRKILVTSISGTEVIRKNRDPGIQTVAPEQALAAIAEQIRNTSADVKVLMVFDPAEEDENKDSKELKIAGEEARMLARQFPLFDLVVVAGGSGDPIMIPEQIAVGNHTTRVIEVGAKGMHVGLVGFWSGRAESERLVYQRVALDPRFEDFKKAKAVGNLNPMEDLFKQYQDTLKDLYVNPASFPDIAFRKHTSGYRFVGSTICMDCHEEEYNIWKDGVNGEEEKGPHFRATRDLTDPGQRTWVPRNFDPECLSCHVTGWNPQEYYPYETGYIDLNKDVDLHGNGCENCHGPASQHVAAENGDIDAEEAELIKYRREVRMTMKDAEKSLCMSCHDIDNSPDYQFLPYWKQIEHGDGIDNVDPQPDGKVAGKQTRELPVGDTTSKTASRNASRQ